MCVQNLLVFVCINKTHSNISMSFCDNFYISGTKLLTFKYRCVEPVRQNKQLIFRLFLKRVNGNYKKGSYKTG